MNRLAALMQQWKEAPEQSQRIVAFGSSNTELTWTSKGRHNWVDWLSINLRSHIGRHVLVMNQGIGGETTEQLLKRLDRDVFSLSPQIAIITIGGNDANKGMPLQRYKENLSNLCSLCLAKGILPVLQTYYCPMYDVGREGFEPLFEGFMEVNRELSQELNIPLIDQYPYFKSLYMNEQTTYKKLMRDFFHVNYLGQIIMGMIASQSFSLPDLQIPDDCKEEIDHLFGKMTHYMNN